MQAVLPLNAEWEELELRHASFRWLKLLANQRASNTKANSRGTIRWKALCHFSFAIALYP
jgi:hypothetical protein